MRHALAVLSSMLLSLGLLALAAPLLLIGELGRRVFGLVRLLNADIIADWED